MIGRRLREVRQLRNLTQEELAERANVGNRQIWRYENEETRPDSDVVARIASALQVSADYLIGLTDDANVNLIESDLSPKEQSVIKAWRLGEKYEAIKVIVDDET